jgi:ABC-type dipeptide/oligopeptide/nickel transport system ATPase component
VECNTPQAIFFSPQHAFTKKLMAALPTIPSSIEIEQAMRFESL